MKKFCEFPVLFLISFTFSIMCFPSSFLYAQETAAVFQYPMGNGLGDMDGYMVSQTFNNYNLSYGAKYHSGLDILLKEFDASGTKGRSVFAIANGKVVFSGNANYPGDVVLIKHMLLDNSVAYSQYGHINATVKTDDIVTIGQQIGTILDQGNNSHLHFEIRSKEKIVNNTYSGPGYTSGDPTSFGYYYPAQFIAEKNSFPMTVKVINTSSLNIRSDHETSSTIIGTLNKEEERTAIDKYITSDGSIWYKVQYDPNDKSRTGWMLGVNHYWGWKDSKGSDMYCLQFYLYVKPQSTRTSTVKQVEYYPTFAVFKNRLYQATKQVSDGAILTRYTEDGDTWTAWTHTGGYTPGTVQMAVFTPQNKPSRLYQAVRGGNPQTTLGSCTSIYTRYSEDGIAWTAWQDNGGCTPGEVQMAVFTPQGNPPRLYQAVRGGEGKIYVHSTEDGDTWTAWEYKGGYTPGEVQMMVFTPQDKPSRLYQAVRGGDIQTTPGTCTPIYTRYTENGITWEPWQNTDDGCTPGEVQTMVFTPEGQPSRLYQAVRGGDAKIYVRSSKDGNTWTAWEHTGGYTPGEVQMMVFTPQGQPSRLYQAVRGGGTQTTPGECTAIYTRYTDDGLTWKLWGNDGGCTPGEIQMAVFSPPNTSVRLYQAVRGEEKIYTRYIGDNQLWTWWSLNDTGNAFLSQGTISSAGGSVALTNGFAVVSFPTGATSQSLLITITELGNLNLPSVEIGYQLVGQGYNVFAHTLQGQVITQFTHDISITLRYDPATLYGRDEHQLVIKYYDEQQARWIPLPSTVDPVQDTVTATTPHFTTFAIFAPDSELPTPIPTEIPPIDVTPINPPNSIPEPTTFLLIGVGLLGLFALMRRKQ